MRNKSMAAVAAGFTLLMSTADAGQLKFAPGIFQIYGGMSNGQRTALLLSPNMDGSATNTAHVLVEFNESMTPGSILIRTAERKLYFVLPNNQAIMYPVGVGRDGFTWSGQNQVSRKAVWPAWTPPAIMITREAERGHIIPDFMEGGATNPLGARALYIGETDFRIHGTTQPWSIGHAVSSGCIRMLNEHVIDLYDRVKLGAKIVVE